MRLLALSLLLAAGLPCNSQVAFPDQYGILETVAGLGKIPTKSENGWKDKYEGREAVKAELSRPHYAMADAAGNIYIADKDAHAIRMIDLEGNIHTVAGTSESGNGGDGKATEQALSRPNGLYVMPDGSYYILDLGNRKIRRVDTAGNMTTVIHDKAGFGLGRGLWVASDEKRIYYVSGRTVKSWTEEDGILAEPLITDLRGPGNIAMDEANDVFYATDRVTGKVYRLDMATGKKTHIAGNGKDADDGDSDDPLKKSLEGVRAVWATPEGGLLLACHESHDVWYISPDNKIQRLVDGGGKGAHSGDGKPYNTDGKKVSEVRSISMDHQGNIIICEHDAGYIRVIRKRTDF